MSSAYPGEGSVVVREEDPPGQLRPTHPSQLLQCLRVELPVGSLTATSKRREKNEPMKVYAQYIRVNAT